MPLAVKSLRCSMQRSDIKTMKEYMIRHAGVVVACLIAVSALACATAGEKSGVISHDGKLAPLTFITIEPVYARTKDDPSKSVFIELSLGVRNRPESAAEIRSRVPEIHETVKSAIRARHHFELYSVNDYERLHVILKQDINRLLRKATVEKVMFLNFIVR